MQLRTAAADQRLSTANFGENLELEYRSWEQNLDVQGTFEISPVTYTEGGILVNPSALDVGNPALAYIGGVTAVLLKRDDGSIDFYQIDPVRAPSVIGSLLNRMRGMFWWTG